MGTKLGHPALPLGRDAEPPSGLVALAGARRAKNLPRFPHRSCPRLLPHLCLPLAADAQRRREPRRDGLGVHLDGHLLGRGQCGEQALELGECGDRRCAAAEEHGLEPIVQEPGFELELGEKRVDIGCVLRLASDGGQIGSDEALRAYEEARRAQFRGKWVVERLVGGAVASAVVMNRAAKALAARRDLADLLVGVTGDFVPAREVLRPGFVLRLLSAAV